MQYLPVFLQKCINIASSKPASKASDSQSPSKSFSKKVNFLYNYFFTFTYEKCTKGMICQVLTKKGYCHRSQLLVTWTFFCRSMHWKAYDLAYFYKSRLKSFLRVANIVDVLEGSFVVVNTLKKLVNLK